MTFYQFEIDPRRRKVARLVTAARRQLQKAFAEEKAEHGFTQAELARTLGVNRSVINRQLMGTENLTLESLAQFAWAFGRSLEVSFPKEDGLIVGNQYQAGLSPFVRTSTSSGISVTVPQNQGPILRAAS